jgi:adenylate cyclase
MTARRLAAIFAADIVGYSRLMGEDEADAARAVRERREAAQPIMANLGGRIVKSTAGDGVLLEFPSIVAAVEMRDGSIVHTTHVTAALKRANVR